MSTLLCSGAAYIGIFQPQTHQPAIRLLRAQENKLFTRNSGSGGPQYPARGSWLLFSASIFVGWQQYLTPILCVAVRQVVMKGVCVEREMQEKDSSSVLVLHVALRPDLLHQHVANTQGR